MVVVPDSELRRERVRLLRRFTLNLSDAIVLPTKVATRAKDHRDRGVLYGSQRPIQGTQGRREKAALVKDVLFSRFCLIRRSVRSRIRLS